MRKALFCCTFAALSALVFVAPVAGQNQLPPSGNDQIGLYTESDFDGPNSVFTEASIGTQFTTYIVLTGLTADSVLGFECLISFSFPGSSVVLSTQFVVPAIDIAGDPSEIQVGFGEPVMAVDGIAYVCTVYSFLLSDQDWMFLGPPSNPSIPDQMAYFDGNDVSNIIVMYPSSGGFDLPVFAINSTDVIATEDASWSDVKSLFR